MISDSEFATISAWCKEYINAKCLMRAAKGHTWPGAVAGTVYSWMLMFRPALYNAEFVAKLFLYKMSAVVGNLNFQLAGLEGDQSPLLTGIPLAADILYGVKLNAFGVRNVRKTYGLLNWIEGAPDPKLPVLLIADICNSGTGLKRCYDICTQQKIPLLNQGFAMVNKFNSNPPTPAPVTAAASSTTASTTAPTPATAEAAPAAPAAPVKATTDLYLPATVKMNWLFNLDDFGVVDSGH
jgi:hypothetical protein